MAKAKPGTRIESVMEPLARWAPLLLLVGGVLGFVGDSYHLYWDFGDLGERSEILATLPYRAHGVLIGVGYGLALAGLAGLLLRRRESVPMTGWLGAVVAFVGTPFVVGDYWAESVVTPGVVATSPALADADASGAHLALVVAAFAVFAIGWLLVGVGLLRGKIAPRVIAIVMIVGAVIAFTPFAGSNLILMGSIAALGATAGRAR